MKSKQKHYSQKGMSLVEVICAIALLAIIAAPILQAIYASLAMNNNSRKQMAANDVGQMVMEYMTSTSYAEMGPKFVGSDAFNVGSLAYKHKPMNDGDASTYDTSLTYTNVDIEKMYMASCTTAGAPYGIHYNSTISTDIFLIENVEYAGYHFNIGVHFEPINSDADTAKNKYYVYKVDVDVFLVDPNDHTKLLSDEPITSYHGSMFNEI